MINKKTFRRPKSIGIIEILDTGCYQDIKNRHSSDYYAIFLAYTRVVVGDNQRLLPFLVVAATSAYLLTQF